MKKIMCLVILCAGMHQACHAMNNEDSIIPAWLLQEDDDSSSSEDNAFSDKDDASSSKTDWDEIEDSLVDSMLNDSVAGRRRHTISQGIQEQYFISQHVQKNSPEEQDNAFRQVLCPNAVQVVAGVSAIALWTAVWCTIFNAGKE